MWCYFFTVKNSLTSFYFLFTQTKKLCSLIRSLNEMLIANVPDDSAKKQRENERSVTKGNHMSRRCSLPDSPKRTQPVNYIPLCCTRFLSHTTFNHTLSSIFVSLTVYSISFDFFFFFGTVKTPYVCLQN